MQLLIPVFVICAIQIRLCVEDVDVIVPALVHVIVDALVLVLVIVDVIAVVVQLALVIIHHPQLN